MLYQYMQKLNLQQMSKIEVDCPLCNSADKEIIQEEFGFKIAKCSRCQFVYTNLRFAEREQDQWYEDHFSRYSSVSSALPIYSAYFDFIKNKIGVSRGILDIGSGYGEFLSVISSARTPCAGVEINSKQREACQQAGLKVFASFDDIVDWQEFDVITLWAVLEHLQNPLGVLQSCYNRLQQGDKVVVLVPNLDYALIKLRLLRSSITGALFRRLSQKHGLGSGIFSPMEHLNHFNLASLARTFQQAGFAQSRFFLLDPIPITSDTPSQLLFQAGQKTYANVTSAIALLSSGKLYLSRTLVMEGVK